MKTEKQTIGKIGEEAAAKFLAGKGFKIVERNYKKKWGEIDIIANQKNDWRFIEVKTMRFENFSGERITPENQITRDKIFKMQRAALAYANLRKIEEWQIDLIAIDIANDNKIINIRHWKNI